MIQIFLRSVSLCSLSNLSMNFLLSLNANIDQHFRIPSDSLFSPFWHTPLSNGTAKINPVFGSRKGCTLFFINISEFLHIRPYNPLYIRQLKCSSPLPFIFNPSFPATSFPRPFSPLHPNSFWRNPNSPKSIWPNPPLFKFSFPIHPLPKISPNRLPGFYIFMPSPGNQTPIAPIPYLIPRNYPPHGNLQG